ncbi:acetyltransferase [Alteromonas sp. a30]|uniref:acetyltransferase n=1 Tax=Alteromonas sp. a30 TaxID=2730917 RepID=UPI0022801DE8|nr:acetyltransferase [Alteromonas sp. a30]MCY7294368.1 acetyltransferase [Alteromonas sp. a30]
MNSKPPLVIVGAGGHGKVVADAAHAQGGFDTVSFLDDRFESLPIQIGFPVIGNDSLIPELIVQGCQFIIAIGDNDVRAEKYQALCKAGADLATVIHPSATVASSVRLGRGVVVLAGAIINASATVADNVIINTGAIVEHDCYIGANTHIAPKSALTGGCSVGESCLIGVGASVIPGKTIGNRVTVGAGAAVTQNIPDNHVAIGVPARW